MKRKWTLATALIGLVFTLLNGGCSKGSDSGLGGNAGGGVTIAATLTVQNTPSFPLWNGDNYSFNYSSTNTTGVKINGISNASSGTINLSGLTKDTTILFETVAVSGATNALPKSVTINVFKIRKTNLCKESKTWKNTYREYLIGGIWVPIVNLCMPTRFYPTGDSCKIYSSSCSGTPDGKGVWWFDGNESHMFYAQWNPEPWIVEKCTKDTLILLRHDSLVRQRHVAF